MWEEVAVAKFNNGSFKPWSEALPSLHVDFAASMELTLDNCPTPITTDQGKAWLGDRKTKLLLVITKWEASGNGAGDHLKNEADLFQSYDQGAVPG